MNLGMCRMHNRHISILHRDFIFLDGKLRY